MDALRPVLRCLLVAFVSVLLGLPTGSLAKTAAPDVRAQFESAPRFSVLRVELVDGREVSGVFAGFIGDWNDSVGAAARYAQWRQAQPEGVPRLGETLTLVTAYGDTLHGGFEGVGPTYVVLGRRDAPFSEMVPAQDITEATADSSASLAPWADVRARLLSAPSFVGVSLKQGEQVVLVARESIRSAGESGSKQAATVDGSVDRKFFIVPTLVVIGVAIVGVLAFWAL